jgi:hypothetical protein
MRLSVNALEAVWFRSNLLKSKIDRLYKTTADYPELDGLVADLQDMVRRLEIDTYTLWRNEAAEEEEKTGVLKP